jgi:4-hydroxymandelate oxidase
MIEQTAAPGSEIAGFEITPELSVAELEHAAQQFLPPGVFDFVAGGAGDELTISASLQAFKAIKLRPRILTDVSSVSCEATILGSTLRCPLFVSPMGGLTVLHPGGEAALAAGAGRAGAAIALSMGSSSSMEEVAAIGGPDRWFQLYFSTRDKGVLRDLVQRAERSGYRALFVTADVGVRPLRRRDLRHVAAGFQLQWHYGNLVKYGDVGDSRYGGEPAEAAGPPTVEWDFTKMYVTRAELEWLRGLTDLPLVVKGVMTAEDAEIAAELGADGVVVSNHGGRQADHALPAISALPEVVAAVGDRLEILFDSGVRRSSDIAIALSLGAKGVGIGRPALWALALAGSDGVANLLGGLAEDLERTMALLGATTLDELGPHCVRAER